MQKIGDKYFYLYKLFEIICLNVVFNWDIAIVYNTFFTYTATKHKENVIKTQKRINNLNTILFIEKDQETRYL